MVYDPPFFKAKQIVLLPVCFSSKKDGTIKEKILLLGQCIFSPYSERNNNQKAELIPC